MYNDFAIVIPAGIPGISRQIPPGGKTVLTAGHCEPQTIMPIGDSRCVLHDTDNLEPLLPAWRDLFSRASAQNPFFTPWSLIPALEAFGALDVKIVTLWRDLDCLIGLFPIARAGKLFDHLGGVSVWRHIHCYEDTPLVRAGEEALFASTLQSALRNTDFGFSMLRFARIPEDTGLPGALTSSQGALYLRRRSFERAALIGKQSVDDVLLPPFLEKKRKELRRLRKRLEKQGDIAVDKSQGADETMNWAEDFLTLERSGWKGREGSALKCNSADTQFFREMVRRAAPLGELTIYRLTLEGDPIAMFVNLLKGPHRYSFKLAYDERYSRFSPGVLLQMEMTHALLADPTFYFMDSCAAPDHPKINRL